MPSDGTQKDRRQKDGTQQDERQKGERSAKRIARAGVCSRRDAERLIADGRVELDGKIVTTPATLVTAAARIVMSPRAAASRSRSSGPAFQSR